MRKFAFIASCFILSSRVWALTNIPLNDSRIFLLGYQSAGTIAGVTATNNSLYQAPGYFSFNGTLLNAYMYSNGATFISIDSGTFTSFAGTNASGWTLVSIASGLSSGTHTVSWYAGTTYLSSTAAFSTDGTGLLTSAIVAPFYQVTSSSFSSYGTVDGTMQTDSQFPGTPETGNTGGGGEFTLRYQGTGAYQSFILTSGGTNAALYQDGVQVSTFNLTTSIGYYGLYVSSAVDPGQHQYKLVYFGYPGMNNEVVGIMPSGSFVATPESVKQTVGFYGDSIIYELGNYQLDLRLGWREAADATGWAAMRYGQIGQPVIGYLQQSTQTVFINGYANPRAVGLVILEGGVNDERLLLSTATFRVAISSQLYNMQQGLNPGVKMLYEGILPNVFDSSADTLLWNQTEQLGVADFNALYPNHAVCWYDTTGWINTTTDTDGDGVHPVGSNPISVQYPFGNPLIGYGKISNRLAPILNAYGTVGQSYSFSGPGGAGGLGVQSGNFIVSMLSSATFTGDQIITLNDASAGGTFTPSVGSPGIGPLAVTPTVGTSSFTFTYTPSISGGSRTITTTAGQSCWIDAPSISYPVLGQNAVFSGSATISGTGVIQ